MTSTPQLLRRLHALETSLSDWWAKTSEVVRIRLVTPPQCASCTSLRLVVRDALSSENINAAVPSVWHLSDEDDNPDVNYGPIHSPNATTPTAALADTVELLALAAATREPIVWHALLRVLRTTPDEEDRRVRRDRFDSACSLPSCAFCDARDFGIDIKLEVNAPNNDLESEPRLVHDALFERERYRSDAGSAPRDALVAWHQSSITPTNQSSTILRCQIQLDGSWLDDRDTIHDVRQCKYADDLQLLLERINGPTLPSSSAAVDLVQVLDVRVLALERRNPWPGVWRVLHAIASSSFPLRLAMTGSIVDPSLCSLTSQDMDFERIEELHLSAASYKSPALFEALADGHFPCLTSLKMTDDRICWLGDQGVQNAEAFGFALLSPDSRLRLERFEISLDRITLQDVEAMARGARGERPDPAPLQSLPSLVMRIDWRSDQDAVLELLQLCVGTSTRAVELEKSTSDTPSSYLAAILSACPSIEELTCRCRWREADALEGSFLLDRLKTLRLLRRDESTDLWPADWDADSIAGESPIELQVLHTLISSCRSQTLRELVWIPEDGIRGERAALEIAQFCPSLERLVMQGVSVDFVDALAASYERRRLSASSLTVYQWMDSYDPETGCCVPIKQLLDVLASESHAMAEALTELEIGVGQRGDCLDPFLVRLLQRNQHIMRCRFSLDGLGTELIDGTDVPQRVVPLSRRHRAAFLSALQRIDRLIPRDLVQLCWEYGARLPSRYVHLDITGGY